MRVILSPSGITHVCQPLPFALFPSCQTPIIFSLAVLITVPGLPEAVAPIEAATPGEEVPIAATQVRRVKPHSQARFLFWTEGCLSERLKVPWVIVRDSPLVGWIGVSWDTTHSFCASQCN